MTEEEFLKKRFKPFEIIQYSSDKIKNIDREYGVIVDCILVGVNFDERLFHLSPIPDNYYDKESFWARCENCQRPRPKLKLIK